MSSQDEGRRAVVFHEAGHCWGYWAVGRRFRYATLRPRTDSFNGATLGYRDWEWDELHALAIVAASGPVAELLHRIERDPRHPDSRSTCWPRSREDTATCHDPAAS